MDKLEITTRKIYFYELKIDYLENFQPIDVDQFREFFSKITKLATKKDPSRYKKIGDKILFIQDIKFVAEEKKIKGKLRCIRQDILPEIIDMESDNTKGIEVEDQEGIVETSHFVIDYSKKTTKIVALEYNQFGARISDFIFYCDFIGSKYQMTSKFDALIITKDNLKKVKESINECSEMTVRVLNTELKAVEKFDNKLFSMLSKCEELFRAKYAQITLKFDFKENIDPNVKPFIQNILSKFMSDKSAKQIFEHFSIKAQDSRLNNRIELFDLLLDKAKVELKVQKKAKYRSIVSVDILDKMTPELVKFKL